jgi:hypothetical protein
VLKKHFLIVALLILSLTGTANGLNDGAYSSAASPLPAVNVGEVHSQPLSLDFPRLGMWFPNLRNQSIAEIARYNWLAMGDSLRELIQPLRDINPGIMLLNSTNGCDLGFNPETSAEPWENEEVRKIPPQWFLTQVGSVLTVAVNDTETQFRVAAVTATSGAEVFDLFVPQEAVLIEGETVWVETVDKVAKTLTVRRGYVRPASSHDAGTRLAAHITFWPRSWLLNLSALCPKAVANVTVGPEIWANYNARKTVALVGSANWDGILLDRVEPIQSWLLGTSTARTIDPDQSNRLLTDYSDFDRKWGDGVRLYEVAIRDALGPGKIVVANNGMANYDLLNGSNFEGFPGAGISTEIWQRMVFGPSWENTGSYFDWMAGGRQPNLSMIETYEDNSGPDPGGNGAYENPCEQPGFVPNYRKMRFGLTTALLNDGFFSYEISGNGHGSLCLLWFDEYDNAGVGRGYLGQPMGPAYLTLEGLDGPNLVGDSSFEVSTGGWSLSVADGYQAAVSLDATTAGQGSASARIDVTQIQGTDWKVSFSRGAIGIESSKLYTLSFWAKADQSDRPLTAWIQKEQPPWDCYIYFADQTLKTDWKHFEIYSVAGGSDPAAGLRFGLGQKTGSVWLDDIRLQVGARQVWRRDYTRGTVLVNPTSETKTIHLGGVYRKIAGSQAPEINNGSRVSVVTLPPFDGLILLRDPLIQVLPSILNFGYVPPGSYKDLTLVIKNIGTGTLTGTVSATPPFSILSGGSYSLGGDQSQVVTVRYQPTSTGTHTGMVVFTGGDGADVPITGITDCSGGVVVLQNVTFVSGDIYNCTATTSITAGIGVTVKSGATVNFRAPIINLQPGFKVESGAVFSAKQ